MEGTYPTMYICMYVLEVEVYICANKDTIALAKVIIEKSRGEVSPMGQDTIENVS